MAEVTDVRYAPDAVRRRLGDTLQVRAAVASSGRAIMVVMSDAGKTGMWEVWGLRLISDPEMRRLRKDADDQL